MSDTSPRRPPSSVEDLERRLKRLAPLLSWQAQAEQELSPTFAASLRARLVEGEATEPATNAARRPGGRSVSRPVRRPWWRGWVSSLSGFAAAVAVLLAVLLTHGGGSSSPSFSVPSPRRADLLFNFPAPSRMLHRLTPTLSLIHPGSALAFLGRLAFGAVRLPSHPGSLVAFRLARPRGLGNDPHELGIQAPLRRVTQAGDIWLVAADGGGRSRRPLHSVALSLTTGELIYHDRRNRDLPYASGRLDQAEAVASARHWLTALGWPGKRMPLRSTGPAPRRPKVRQIVFGWIGPGRAAVEAATLWVTPNGSVIEAWIWPPVERRTGLSPRSFASAWHDIARGRLPLAVLGATRGIGVAVLRHVSTVSVLTHGSDRRLYLVPAYRFQGVAHLQGMQQSLPWYSLAPADGQ